MAENQVQSEKKMTSLNVSSETRDAIKDISTSLGLSQADTVARLVDGYHPNATPGVKAALDASAVLDEAVERVKRIIVGAAEAAAMEARAAREDADADKKSAMEQIQSIKSNCVEQVAAIKEKFELDTASLEIENDELHAAVNREMRAVDVAEHELERSAFSGQPQLQNALARTLRNQVHKTQQVLVGIPEAHPASNARFEIAR